MEKDILERDGRVTAAGLCESALRGVRQIEDMGYEKLVISLKSSDVRMNCEAYELIARKTPHPLHIGVTEAGTYEKGRLRSAVGIGSAVACVWAVSKGDAEGITAVSAFFCALILRTIPIAARTAISTISNTIHIFLRIIPPVCSDILRIRKDPSASVFSPSKVRLH